jgi:cytochrome b561
MPADPLESSKPLPARYGAGAMALHWAMFVLVVVVGTLGLLHDDWPKATQGFWINVHALIGLGLWAVLLARLWYRRLHPPPALPAGVGALSRRLSGPVHWALYALLFVIPVIGAVTFVYHGRDLSSHRGPPRLSRLRALRARRSARPGRLVSPVFSA